MTEPKPSLDPSAYIEVADLPGMWGMTIKRMNPVPIRSAVLPCGHPVGCVTGTPPSCGWCAAEQRAAAARRAALEEAAKVCDKQADAMNRAALSAFSGMEADLFANRRVGFLHAADAIRALAAQEGDRGE